MEETQLSPQRTDRASKHFLSKGSRMMRRQTSKFSVLASSHEDGRAAGLARVRSAGHLLNLHTKRGDARPQISGPYDFQHVAHTDQSQYQSLDRSNATNLAESFSALHADQQPGQEIKGIPVADLPSSSDNTDHFTSSAPQSPTLSVMPSLENSPPKPAPPPKDLHLPLPSLGGDIRISRSIENFSWPTPSPNIDSCESFGTENSSIIIRDESVSSTSDHLSSLRLVGGPNAVHSNAPAPSSLLPPVTADMLDKPLPQPPTVVHAVSTVDEGRLPMKNSPLPQLPQSSPVEDVVGEPAVFSPKIPAPVRSVPLHSERLSRRRSQSSSDLPFASTFASTAAVLASPPRRARTSKRISVGIKKIDIDDWEDAIDYSWDHALDGDEEIDYPAQTMTNSDVLPQRSSAFIPKRMSSVRHPDHLVWSSTRSVRTTRSEFDLQGLGIDAVAPEKTFLAESEYEDYSEKHESLKVPFKRREPGSPISKSSSQESIILSIASSIMSTHRSSNSSTSLGDMSHLESIKDEDATPEGERQIPSAASGSVSSSETVTTDQKSVPMAESPVDDDTVVELPTQSHQRGVSASRVPFSHSNNVPQTKTTMRQRSSTQSSGRRLNSRASYSLFPTPASANSAN
jgi:hypothetical protein